MARLAIAYVRALGTGADANIDEDADALCAAQGFELVGVVREDRGADGSALATALGRIAAGDASVLLVARLAAPSSSLRELIALLDWLEAARADLVAIDVALDTGTPAGRRMVRLLHEVARWEREPERPRPPRGRPGLATTAPELRDRIVALRAEGVSLQAIADALNADAVPTRRGGARWRPSSVQAALGYRRPRPLPPGAPRLPGPPPPPHARRLPGRSRPPDRKGPGP